MEITGKLIVKSPTQDISVSFRKSEIVIETEEQYPQKILIEFTQDRCDLVDPYKIGEVIKVHINLRGREWINPQGESKYFNSIHGWRVERLNPAPPAPAVNQPKTETNPQQANAGKEEGHDDLPF